ncbi:MAG: hypothetical protein IK083_10365 [Abditibacteriota bacterium]|nr:hypothetical protein [Abditibacteriota bacterium]
MKKLVITLLLITLSAGLALAKSDIKAGNMLQNYEFYTAGADPSMPEHWEIDGALAPDFSYSGGTLSFRNTSATGTVTPQYVYQDVNVAGGTGRLYTVGMDIESFDAFMVYKFRSLDEGNVGLQIQWLDADGKVIKSEKPKGFLESHFLFYSMNENDRALERTVYCPADSSIVTCRFCLYVERGIYAQKITFNQAWMYPAGKPAPYIALAHSAVSGSTPVAATGNVVSSLNVGFEAVGDDSYFADEPSFRIYPVMAPDKYIDDCTATRSSIGGGKVLYKGRFNDVAGYGGEPEPFVLEMRCKSNGSEAVIARDYFYYEPGAEGVNAGWQFDEYGRFLNRSGRYSSMFGVSFDLDRGYGEDYSVFYEVGVDKYIKGLEAASADLIEAKVNWKAGDSTLYMNWSKYAPGCKWLFDVSDHMYNKGELAYDWYDIINNARMVCDNLMGFVGCDKLSAGNLSDAVKFREQLRSSDRKPLAVNRLAGVSAAELNEAAVYSRTAGDAVMLDLMPSNGSDWRDGDFPISDPVFDDKAVFDRPVFAIAKAGGLHPKNILRLMQYSRNKNLAGLIFDVNPSNAFQSDPGNPQMEWGNFVAAMFIKDFLNDAVGLIANFSGDSGSTAPAGVDVDASNSVVRIMGTSQIDNTNYNVLVNEATADECFFIVITSMKDSLASRTAEVRLQAQNTGYVCDLKSYGIDGSVTVQQLDADTEQRVYVNGVSVFYIHKAE